MSSIIPKELFIMSVWDKLPLHILFKCPFISHSKYIAQAALQTLPLMHAASQLAGHDCGHT